MARTQIIVRTGPPTRGRQQRWYQVPKKEILAPP